MASKSAATVKPTIKSRRQRIEAAGSVRAVIEAMGGVKEVADTVGVQHPSVCQWVREDKIPQARVATLAKIFRVTRSSLNRFVLIR